MTEVREMSVDRDPLVGPDPTWEMLPEAERKRWIDEIRDFPPPPLMLELLGQDLMLEHYNPQALADKFSRDAVLVGRILARANSAAMGLRKTVTSVQQAIVVLGFNLVRSTVLRYQIEVSALKLQGLAREHIMRVQSSTDLGAVIAYNWAKAAKHFDPASVATLCLLSRLGTFLLGRRFPDEMPGFFAAGHEPQRLNYEANQFGITTRSLTYKVAQAWRLPTTMQLQLYHVWTPLFAPMDEAGQCIACAGLSLGFDPPHHQDDIQKWLALRVNSTLRANLESSGALHLLPNLIDSEVYQREIAAVNES